jgi:hypothetical protein
MENSMEPRPPPASEAGTSLAQSNEGSSQRNAPVDMTSERPSHVLSQPLPQPPAFPSNSHAYQLALFHALQQKLARDMVEGGDEVMEQAKAQLKDIQKHKDELSKKIEAQRKKEEAEERLREARRVEGLLQVEHRRTSDTMLSDGNSDQHSHAGDSEGNRSTTASPPDRPMAQIYSGNTSPENLSMVTASDPQPVLPSPSPAAPNRPTSTSRPSLLPRTSTSMHTSLPPATAEATSAQPPYPLPFPPAPPPFTNMAATAVMYRTLMQLRGLPLQGGHPPPPHLPGIHPPMPLPLPPGLMQGRETLIPTSESELMAHLPFTPAAAGGMSRPPPPPPPLRLPSTSATSTVTSGSNKDRQDGQEEQTGDEAKVKEMVENINEVFNHQSEQRYVSFRQEAIERLSLTNRSRNRKSNEAVSSSQHGIDVVGLGEPEGRDAAYLERRRRNNEAAKRSRDLRRQKEQETFIRCQFLERENAELKEKIKNYHSLIVKVTGSKAEDLIGL